MRRRLRPGAALVATLLFGACRASIADHPHAEKTRAARLLIDGPHDVYTRGRAAAPYAIAPAPAVLIRDEGFGYADGSEPEAVHVRMPDGRSWRTPWDGEGEVLVGPSTLEPVTARGAFPGFRPGRSYLIGVGAEERRDGALALLTMWVGAVRVGSGADQ